MPRSKHIQEIEEEPTVKALRFVSLNLGLTALAYSLLYVGPEVWVRTQRSQKAATEQTSIVQNIESIGPVWPFLFFLAGCLVVGSTVLGRGVIVSHGVAAGVWVTYGSAILLGALLSQPPSPIVSGFAAIFGAITHIGMARAWAGEGVR